MVLINNTIDILHKVGVVQDYTYIIETLENTFYNVRTIMLLQQIQHSCSFQEVEQRIIFQDFSKTFPVPISVTDKLSHDLTRPCFGDWRLRRFVILCISYI